MRFPSVVVVTGASAGVGRAAVRSNGSWDRSTSGSTTP
jgi:NADP-dependent 3-hydroxy acid dehydrogenase YdfG